MSSDVTAAAAGATAVMVGFELGGDLGGAELAGFSGPEPVGTWSLGERSEVVLPRPSPFERLELAVKLLPFTSAGGPHSQELRISVNGEEIYARRFDSWATLRVRVPAARLVGRETVAISFYHPEAMAPALVSDIADGRQLGFLFAWLELRPAGEAAAVRAVAKPLGEPVFHVERQGQLANQMIQYLVARKLQSLVPGCRISNVEIPEWGIDHPAIAPEGPVHRHGAVNRLELENVAAMLNARMVQRCEWGGYGQRMENYPSLEECRAIFPFTQPDVVGFGDDDLVIHVRGADSFDGVNQDYPLLPIGFLREVVEQSGLRPVFLGQITSNRYIAHLRGAFPAAMFLGANDRMVDFEILRRSRNIVVSVSTFAWLAAWLSEARQIVLPVNGLFSPFWSGDIDFLPLDDPRYRFVLFPANFPVPADDFAAAHAPIEGLWREVTPAVLRRLLAERPRFGCTVEDYLALFEEAHYLRHHPQVGQAVAAGWFASAREHYAKVGFAQRFIPFSIDARWYSRQYPVAALEVGQGDYLSFADHYVAIGARRGYRPMPI